ncbi:hypothetical protein [Gordoniibacillus kamchatkensis]|nr:hypothetical protein [Paenibacillus sp. VKM B-2647]
MADACIFDDLAGAIQNAFVRANTMLQDRQVQTISTYFDARRGTALG